MDRNDKGVIINQFQGLGDLLFIEPIMQHYHDKGYKVIVPVNDDYIWLQEYIPYVEFKKKSEFEIDYEYFGFTKMFKSEYIPLRFSTPLLRNMEPHSGDNKEHFMLDKYRLLELPLDMWRQLKWRRDEEKENRLFNFLGLHEDSEYTFVNEYYGGGFQKIDIPVTGKRVYLTKHEGYTLLDWAKVIENARHIKTVETSILYMIEVLNLKAETMKLYSRPPEEKPIGVLNFISNKWEIA